MTGMRRVGGTALAIVLGLSLVACGGDDDGDGKAALDAAVDGDVDLSDFTGECAAFMGAFAGASASIGSAFSGAPADDLETAAEYFNQVARDIPEEIRADFEIFAAAYTGFAEALAEADIDFSDPASFTPERIAELESVTEAFSAPEVEEASANVQAYLDDNCGGEPAP